MTDDLRLRVELVRHVAATHESARRLIRAVERRRWDGPPDSAGSDAAGWQRAMDALCGSDVWREFAAASDALQAWAESLNLAASAQPPPSGAGPEAGA